jgi:hypothetical protein
MINWQKKQYNNYYIFKPTGIKVTWNKWIISIQAYEKIRRNKKFTYINRRLTKYGE